MGTASFRSSITGLLVACAFSLPGVAQAPQPAVQGDASGPIRLNVVVTPRSGAPIGDLPQSAFTVLDNGRPEPIQAFRAFTGAAVKAKVLIVVDAVNIPYIQLAYERNQIENFLRSNDGKLTQPTALAVFTDTNIETTGFQTDGNALSKTLDAKGIGLRDLRRSAGFYGAEERLELSLRALQGFVARARTIPGRKIIIWVSPGWPLLSGPAVQLTGKQEQGLFDEVATLTNSMRDSDLTLYSVDPLGAQESPGRTFYYEEFLKGLRKPSQALPGDLGLQVLAIQSGGLALSSSNDVRALLLQCMDDAKAYYEISFIPPPPDAPSEYHKIDVKVAMPSVTARTTQGYYSAR